MGHSLSCPQKVWWFIPQTKTKKLEHRQCIKTTETFRCFLGREYDGFSCEVSWQVLVALKLTATATEHQRGGITEISFWQTVNFLATVLLSASLFLKVFERFLLLALWCVGGVGWGMLTFLCLALLTWWMPRNACLAPLLLAWWMLWNAGLVFALAHVVDATDFACVKIGFGKG